MTKISQETLMPIGLAVLVIGGGAMWVTNIKNQLDLDRENISSLVKNYELYTKTIVEIDSRLSRIEWKMEKQQEK